VIIAPQKPRRFEAISGAAHGFQIARIFRVGLDFFADAADVNIDRTRRHVSGVAPDGVEQVVAAEDASLVAREVIEQAKFGGRGRDQAAAHHERHGRGIDFNVADFHGTRRQRPLEAAQHGLDAGNQFARAERLGDVVVGAEFEAEDAVGFAALRRQKNDRHRREAGNLADAAAEFKAVFARDHDVENEQRRALPLGVGQYVGAGWVDADDEALVFEVVADEARNIRIVFNDEYAWFHGDIVTKRVQST
jgi:hypothetical protein